jgi:hypothetical protein
VRRLLDDLEHLAKLPETIPAGKAVVHSYVRPPWRLGSRGSRAYLTSADRPGIEPCDCGWAPELGTHYRFTRPRATSQRAVERELVEGERRFRPFERDAARRRAEQRRAFDVLKPDNLTPAEGETVEQRIRRAATAIGHMWRLGNEVPPADQVIEEWLREELERKRT